MPRSQPAPPAPQPAPVRRLAVIAATTGIAGIVGLVLLGVGTAAASSGPSPGPAAGPTPVVPASSLPPADVETGMPPVLPSVVVTLPGPHTDVTVAQQGPVPSAPSSDVQVAAMGVLPRTGVTPGVVVGLAWTAVVAGAALLAIRAVPRLPVRLARIRTGRRGRGNGDRASR